MNIFKVIFSGQQRFKEPYSSSILGYLLSPTMDHGLGCEFLKRLMILLKKDSDPAFRDAIYQLGNISMTNYSQKTIVDVWLEYKRCDVVAIIRNPTTSIRGVVLLIENKIYASSVNDIVDQVSGYESDVTDALNREEVEYEIFPSAQNFQYYKVCVLPTQREANDLLRSLDTENEKHKNIFAVSWLNDEPTTESKTISDIMSDLIKDSSNGAIPPLPSDIDYMFRSYINFMKDAYRGYTADPTRLPPISLEEKREYDKFKVRIKDIVYAVSKEAENQNLLSTGGLAYTTASTYTGKYVGLQMNNDNNTKRVVALLGIAQDLKEHEDFILALYFSDKNDNAIEVRRKLNSYPSDRREGWLEVPNRGIAFKLDCPGDENHRIDIGAIVEQIEHVANFLRS